MWSFGTTMTMAKDTSNDKPLEKPLETHQSLQPPHQNTIPPPEPRTPILSQRSLKQLGLFFGGAGFLALSTLVTRRAVLRKRMVTVPKFYNPSNRLVDKIDSDGSFIAFEALNLATLNVVGFGIMATGGLAWAFDISSVDDLRKKARHHIGPPGGQADEEVERAVEEWVAKVLLKKEPREEKNQEADPSPKKNE